MASRRSSGRRRGLASAAALATSIALATSMALLALAPLALPESYSWIELGTSESAAQGVEGAWVARAGFVGATPMLMSTPVWGIVQRFMFLTAALWYASEALDDSGP